MKEINNKKLERAGVLSAKRQAGAKKPASPSKKPKKQVKPTSSGNHDVVMNDADGPQRADTGDANEEDEYGDEADAAERAAATATGVDRKS